MCSHQRLVDTIARESSTERMCQCGRSAMISHSNKNLCRLCGSNEDCESCVKQKWENFLNFFRRETV